MWMKFYTHVHVSQDVILQQVCAASQSANEVGRLFHFMGNLQNIYLILKRKWLTT